MKNLYFNLKSFNKPLFCPNNGKPNKIIISLAKKRSRSRPKISAPAPEQILNRLRLRNTLLERIFKKSPLIYVGNEREYTGSVLSRSRTFKPAKMSGLRHTAFISYSVVESVLFGRSRCKGPAPSYIKQTKFSMIFSSLVPTLIKGY